MGSDTRKIAEQGRFYSDERGHLSYALLKALSDKERLRALVRELADSHEALIEHQYKGLLGVHNVMDRRYDKHMEVVRRAREALEGGS